MNGISDEERERLARIALDTYRKERERLARIALDTAPASGVLRAVARMDRACAVRLGAAPGTVSRMAPRNVTEISDNDAIRALAELPVDYTGRGDAARGTVLAQASGRTFAHALDRSQIGALPRSTMRVKRDTSRSPVQGAPVLAPDAGASRILRAERGACVRVRELVALLARTKGPAREATVKRIRSHLHAWKEIPSVLESARFAGWR